MSSKLHLGCGENIIEGWVNVDIGSDDPRVVVGDVRNLESIAQDASVELIYACHVFEHIPRSDEVPVLKHWLTRLEPGGACYVSVPDFGYLVSEYVRALDSGTPWWNSLIISALVGGYDDGSDDEHNHHHSLFDYSFLQHLMTEAGFIGVRRYEPTELGFNPADHSLLPLSLNVVGFRPAESEEESKRIAAKGEMSAYAHRIELHTSMERQAMQFERRVRGALGDRLGGLALNLLHRTAWIVRPLRRWMAGLGK